MLNIHVNVVGHLVLLLRAFTGQLRHFSMCFMGQRRQVNDHVVRSQVTLLKYSNKGLIVVPWRNGCSNGKKIENNTELRFVLEEMGHSNS